MRTAESSEKDNDNVETGGANTWQNNVVSSSVNPV